MTKRLMTRWWHLAAAGALATVMGSGCLPYRIHTPSSMVELEEDRWSSYDYRATTADGVVLAVRTLRMRESGGDIPYGDLEFWTDATELRMRTRGGYALLEQLDVTSGDGTPGVQMRFGRDQEDISYIYWVTLYLTPKYLHVVETGGAEELFTSSEDAIASAIETYRCRR